MNTKFLAIALLVAAAFVVTKADLATCMKDNGFGGEEKNDCSVDEVKEGMDCPKGCQKLINKFYKKCGDESGFDAEEMGKGLKLLGCSGAGTAGLSMVALFAATVARFFQ